MIQPLDNSPVSRLSRVKAKDRSSMQSSPEFPAAAVAPPAAQTATLPLPGHSFEARIRHDLMACSELQFSSLVVRRIPDGICLEGVVSTAEDRHGVCQLVRELAGVNAVLNHLVMCPKPKAQPPKG